MAVLLSYHAIQSVSSSMAACLFNQLTYSLGYITPTRPQLWKHLPSLFCAAMYDVMYVYFSCHDGQSADLETADVFRSNYSRWKSRTFFCSRLEDYAGYQGPSD